MKGLLKLIVLKELERGEATGYDLMTRIGEKVRRPSPGSLYPLLRELKEKGFLKMRVEGRRKVYSLSEKGREILREFKEREKEEILRKIEILKSSGVLSEREVGEIVNFITERREIIMKLHTLRNWSKFVEAVSKAMDRSKSDVESLLEEFIKRIDNI